MRNIQGSPVEGDDFFERPRDLARLQRELSNSAHVLLTAPRRVGKTSLVLRLCSEARAQGQDAVYFNVEGCADELTFFEKIVSELQDAGLHPEALSRVSLGFQRMRHALQGLKFKAGIDVEMGGAEEPELSTLGKAIESIFHRIEKGSRTLILVVDEFPELLLALLKEENGLKRVEHLLHWFRALRQTYRKRVQWVFLGSIGLDNFVDEHRFRKTINDLTSLGLEALTPEEADTFLDRLGRDNQRPIPPELRQEIIRRVGWPLPHHLQVVFHALVETEASPVDAASLDKAFAFLCSSKSLSQFDTWRQRLDEQFSLEDATASKLILKEACVHQAGRTRAQLLGSIVAAKPSADPAILEEQLARLLQALQRDGYLLHSHGAYAFRSFLLREFWRQHYCL